MSKSYTKLLLATSLLTTLSFSPNMALAVSDAEFAALKEQMGMFAKQLETLEQEQAILRKENVALKQQNTALKIKNEKLSGDLDIASEKTASAAPSSRDMHVQAQSFSAVEPAAGGKKQEGFQVPGTDTRIKLGGYVKVDAIHDFNMSRTGSGEDFGLYSAIPLDNSDEDEKGSNTRIHARQTRLNMTATTPTEYGDLKLFVEGDFFGGGGSQTSTNANGFALRHAYGELGGFLVGQTWSNYMDLPAYPESLDFQGVSGNTLLRQG
jgi:regulator of replication initiation timing